MRAYYWGGIAIVVISFVAMIIDYIIRNRGKK